MYVFRHARALLFIIIRAIDTRYYKPKVVFFFFNKNANDVFLTERGGQRVLLNINVFVLLTSGGVEFKLQICRQ